MTQQPMLVEYAITSRGSCKRCRTTIDAGDVRVGVRTKSNFHDGYDTSWNHLECVKGKIKELSDLTHWEGLRWTDQVDLRQNYCGEAFDDTIPELIEPKERNLSMWKLKDELKSGMKNKDIKTALTSNNIVFGKASMPWLLHLLADALLYGKIGLCPTCNTNGLYHTGFKYKCKGHISDFTRCSAIHQNGEVKRYKFVVPKELKKTKFFKNFKFGADHPKEEFVLEVVESYDSSLDIEGGGEEGLVIKMNLADDEEEMDNDVPEDEVPMGKELFGMLLAIAGSSSALGYSASELKEMIEDHGGNVVTSVKDNTSAVVTAESLVSKKKAQKKIRDAKEKGIPMLSVAWLEDLTNRDGSALDLRKLDNCRSYLLGDSVPDPSLYRLARPYRSGQLGELKRSAPSTATLNPEPIPGSPCLEIDPECPFSGEIYVGLDSKHGYTPYNVVLNQADILTGTNKYYKMHVINTNKNTVFWASYGRIGSNKGGTMKRVYDSPEPAMEIFIEKFEKFTGWKWNKRHRFKKQPGKYMWSKLSDGLDELKRSESKRGRIDSAKSSAPATFTGSKLDARVKEFLELIFDKKMMEKQLMSFDVDLEKMPLGQITTKQIEDGFSALTAISELLEEGASNPATVVRVADLTNKFYTMIPHDFGDALPPLLDSLDAVTKKVELLSALLDIEVAAKVLEDEAAVAGDPIDKHYRSLNSSLTPVEKGTELWDLLTSYMIDGHDAGFADEWTPVPRMIFEINQFDVIDKYQPWKDNENRQLLWHASRLTNWVSIISQGMRIAPPNAPKTGYRFGKGVYFADCVSKSAHYCFTSPESPTGVMLLGEVALGRMKEVKKDTYMEKARPGFDSTKALGMNIPDPKGDFWMDDGVKVPKGAPKALDRTTKCSHNEYIVYDTAQINFRYLFVVDFDYQKKRRRRRRGRN